MTTSHADSHDLDKLARWHEGLSTDGVGQFPLHAIFLVSADDRAAHDIFRQFRSSFESHSARFHHLVIFGQHGLSSTVSQLLSEFGLTCGSIPALVLFERSSASEVYALSLAGGGGSGDDRRWKDVLAQVEGSAGRGEVVYDLASVPWLSSHHLGDRLLIDLIAGVLKGLI